MNKYMFLKPYYLTNLQNNSPTPKFSKFSKIPSLTQPIFPWKKKISMDSTIFVPKPIIPIKNEKP